MAQDLSVPLITLAKRRMHGVRTVATGAVNREIPQSEFVARITEIQREATHDLFNMTHVVEGLWQSEGFATTFGKYRLPDNTLNDPQLPRESHGITHVGYGAATTEYTHFDPKALHDIFEQKAAPAFRGFSFEGIGSALRIYEPGFFKFMCGMLGLIPKGAPPGPDKTGFFSAFLSHFSAENQRLIVHGYGRLVAFSNLSIYKAIDEAVALPPERVQPAVMGIAFAFTMMNSQDMSRMLASSAIDYPAPVRAAFQNGLIYALVFCDWFTPKFLEAWRTRGGLEEKLIEKARAEAELNQRRGYPLAFQLENPLT